MDMPLSLDVYLTVLNRKCYYMGEPDAGLEEYISQTQPKKTTCYREAAGGAVSVPVQKTGQNNITMDDNITITSFY